MTKGLLGHIASDATATLADAPADPTFADVFWSYRLLLQRTPEFADEDSYRRRCGLGLRNLVESFLKSPEFNTLWGNELGAQPLPNLVLLAQLGEFRFWFNLRDQAIGQNIAKGSYEPAVTSFVTKTVKPGMNCLDVGANLGYFSVLLASLVGSRGSVYSFEPFPSNYELLVRNLRENHVDRIVRPLQVAAYDRSDNGRLFFRADALNDNFGSMFVSDQSQDAHLQSSSVARTRIDEAVPLDVPIDFVKIDVEGAEILALRGMSRILELYHPPLVIEVNELALARGDGSTPEELLALLKSFGYVIREVGTETEYRLPADRTRVPLLNDLVCTFEFQR